MHDKHRRGSKSLVKMGANVNFDRSDKHVEDPVLFFLTDVRQILTDVLARSENLTDVLVRFFTYVKKSMLNFVIFHHENTISDCVPCMD